MTQNKCKICSRPPCTIIDRKLNTPYYYCCHCSFISKDDEHLLPPEEEKQRYLKHDNNLENSGYVNMLETFINESIIPFNDKIRKVPPFV